MTDKPHTPTTAEIRNAVTRDESDWREAGAHFDRWLAERDARIESAAEQRGAEKALRHVASMIKLGNEYYEILVEDELNDRADQIINQTKTRNLKD